MLPVLSPFFLSQLFGVAISKYTHQLGSITLGGNFFALLLLGATNRAVEGRSEKWKLCISLRSVENGVFSIFGVENRSYFANIFSVDLFITMCV